MLASRFADCHVHRDKYSCLNVWTKRQPSPLSIVEYTPNLQYGLDALYYPLFSGTLFLIVVLCVSMFGGILIYNGQEV